MKNKYIKNILIIILFGISLKNYGQFITDKLVNEYSIAIGSLIEDTKISETMEKYCYETKYEDKEIKKGSKIIISDVKYCKKGYSEHPYEYFEIIYNNKTYYIEKEKIITEESYFDEIAKMNFEFKLKFKDNAKKIADLAYQDKLNEVKTFINSCSSKGLVILDWSFYDESDYTNGTSIKISVINPTKKNIKYLWFTFSGYNAVDDLIFDRIKGKSKITVKGVGPITPGESGEYEYEYVWHTDLVQKVKINQIKIQFMDGSIKIVLLPKQITLDNNFLELLNGE